MQVKLSTLLSSAFLLSALVATADAASLVGTSVTGSLMFAGDPSNYFDPGYGFAPLTDLNAIDNSTTVTISNTAVEFGYDDGANLITVDFTDNGVTMSDVVELTGSNVPITMTFTDPALVHEYAPALPGIFSISGDVLTANLPGGNVTMGQPPITYSSGLVPVPEPSTKGFVYLTLFAFGILSFRTSRRTARSL